MGLGTAGGTARFLRASLIEVMSQDYIRAARAKGLSERRVVWVHGLRNAIVPVIQVFAIHLPLLLSGALIIEVVFSWPGLGQLTFLAISTRDYPLILGAVALSATLVILGNLLADVLHALVDPRVRDASGVDGARPRSVWGAGWSPCWPSAPWRRRCSRPTIPTEQLDPPAGQYRRPGTALAAVHLTDGCWRLADRVRRTPEGLDDRAPRRRRDAARRAGGRT